MCQPPATCSACSISFILTTVLWQRLISDEKRGQWGEKQLSPAPQPQFADPGFAWSLCVSLWCCWFLLSGPGITPANHFHLRASTVWPFLLFLSPSHDVKKEKVMLGRIFNNRKQKYMYLPHMAPLCEEGQTRSAGSDGVIFTWSSWAGWGYSLFLGSP